MEVFGMSDFESSIAALKIKELWTSPCPVECTSNEVVFSQKTLTDEEF
jgi:hypothetical protein